jgi:preprotein translocase subunit SecA
MDHLKTGIGLRGYGQIDPRVEYEKEAYEIFEDLKSNIADEAIKGVFRVVIEQAPPEQLLQQAPSAQHPPQVPAFPQIPSGAMVPQAVEGPTPAPHLDERLAESLLGPLPGKARGPVHTNRDGEEPAKPLQREAPKVGRNDLCPCGSGKKYKKCHGTAV